MTPIDVKAKKELTDKISKAIGKVLDSPDLNQLSDKQIEAIAKRYYLNTLTKEFEKEVHRSKLNEEALQKLIDQWLDDFTSPHTSRSFKKNLNYFLDWLKGKSIVDVNSKVVDKYVSELKNDMSISDNTKRQRVAACSSFFTTLVRWEVVNRNPFHGIKGLPKKKIAIKQEEQIPTDKELDLLEKYALTSIKTARKNKGKGYKRKLEGNIKALCTLHVLRNTGLRIGALTNLVIDKNGYYKARTKGSEAQGRLGDDILRIFDLYGLSKRQPFKEYSSNTFTVWLWRSLTSGEMKNKINKLFSAHGIRHRYAINFYTQTKDVHELSKRLGHSSLLVTTAYLSGLKSELGKLV